MHVRGGPVLVHVAAVMAAGALAAPLCAAQPTPACSGLPDAQTLRGALQSVVKEGASKNGGMGNQEWAVIVNRDGIGCAVVMLTALAITAAQDGAASAMPGKPAPRQLPQS